MLIPVRQNKAIQWLIAVVWLLSVYSFGDENGVSRITWAGWNLVILPVMAYWYIHSRARWEWQDFPSVEEAENFKQQHFEVNA